MKNRPLVFRSLSLSRFWRLVVLPFLVYTAAALFMTWPLATQLSTHVAGHAYTDSFEYTRLGWWGKYALQNKLNPFYQSLLGYPDGFFSATQAAQPLIYWPITLLGFIFDPVAAFNVWLLLEVILSGLAAYWLCREVIGDKTNPLPALVGGLIFMAFPAVQGHISAGHVNPLSNYALPVLTLCLYRIVVGWSGIRTALIGAVAMWVLALGNFTFPAFALLPLVLFGGGYLLLFRRGLLRRSPRTLLRDLAILIGGGALLMLPFYLPLLSELTSTNRPLYLQEVGWVLYSTDPLAFIALSPFSAFTAPITPEFSRVAIGVNSIEGTAYLGIAAVGLAAIAVWRRRHAGSARLTGMWLAIALGCMLFSLGPLLKWRDQPVEYTLGDYKSHIVLPWAAFQNLPLLSATRTPGRFNMTTGLALGVLAALGLSAVQAALPRVLSKLRIRAALAQHRLLPTAMTLTIIVFILLEYQLFFPFPTTSAALPPYFESLAKRDDVRAVFDVPWNDPLAQKAAMYQQVAHQKPIIAGYVSRRTPVDPAKLALLSDVAIGKLDQPFHNISTAIAPGDAPAILRGNGIDVVVYHLELLDKQAVLAWATKVFGSAAYLDNRIAIFEVPKTSSRPQVLPLALSSGGWWRKEGIGKPWLQGDAEIYFYTDVVSDQRWSFRVVPLLHPRHVQVFVDNVPVQNWQSDGASVLDLWLRLEPGFHTLRFSLLEPCTPVNFDPTCLLSSSQASNISEPGCQLKDYERERLCVGVVLEQTTLLDPGEMTFREQQIRLANGMTLLGFRALRAAKPNDVVSVQTEWRAAQKLPGDYHVFVHLLDKNGKMIAQADNVPGGGTFPTMRWTVPQMWSEMMNIRLPADLLPGTYSLYAGWYSYPDLTRLRIEDSAAAGPRAQDGLIFLQDIEIK
jgi:hypothetical protein